MLETPQSVRGRRTSRKSTKSISKVNQEIVSSLNSVSNALDRMERGLSSLTRSFTQEMTGMRYEANKYGKETSEQLIKHSEDAKKAMQSVVKSNEQIVSDFQRSVRRIGNIMKGFMGFFVGTIIIKGIRKVTDFLQLNFFDFMTSRIKQIKELLMSVVPGAEAALAALRSTQETMSSLQQSYGLNASERREWRTWSENLVDEYMTVPKLMAGVEAMYTAGIGGSLERREEIAERITYISEVTGLGLDRVAESYSRLHDVQGLSHEGTLAYFETMRKFSQISRTFERSVGMEDLQSMTAGSFDFFRNLEAFSEGGPETFSNLQKLALVTSQLASSAQISGENLMELVQKSVTMDSSVLALQGMSPQDAQEMLAEGDIAGFYGVLASGIDRTIGQLGDSVAAADAINREFGTSFTSEQLLRFSETWKDLGGEIIPAANEAIAQSTGEFSYWKEEIRDVTTEAERFQNRINEVIYDMNLGDMPMTEVVQFFDNVIPQLDAITGSFSAFGQVSDMLFGPFSGVVKPGMNFMGTLFMLGGATTELTDDMREQLGVAAPLFDFMQKNIGEFLPTAERILRNVVDVFDGFFSVGDDGKSIFQRFIEHAVDWLSSDKISGEGGILTRLMDGLTHVFEVLGNEFDRLMTSDFGQRLTGFLTSLMTGLAKLLGTMVQAMIPIVTTMLKTMGDVLGDSGVVQAIGDFTTSLFSSLAQAIVDNWDNIKAALMPLVEIIWEVLKLGFFGLMTLIAPVIDNITDALNPLGGGTNLAGQFQWANLGSFIAGTGSFGGGIQPLLTSTQVIERNRNEADKLITELNVSLQQGEITPEQHGRGVAMMYTHGQRGIGFGGMTASVLSSLIGGDSSASLPFDVSEYESGTGVTSPYGWRTLHGGMDFHRGIDFGLGAGDIVRAIQGGIVDKIGTIASEDGGGSFIRILTDDGRYWQYNHMSPNLNFNEGDSVKAGDQLGTVGDTVADHLDVKTYTATGDSRSYDNPERIMKQLGLDFAYQTARSEGSWSRPSGMPERIRGATLQGTTADSLANIPETEAGARAFAESLSKDMKRTAEAVEKIVSDARMDKMDRDLNRAMNK